MDDILQTIVAHKLKEIEQRKGNLPLQELRGRVEQLPGNVPHRSMRAALASSPTGIIAEFKRKSPSKGWLHPGADVADVVPAYEDNGAAACSILTDTAFFGGSLEDLQRARQLVRLPLLRKDFVLDEYQLYEAKRCGADAVLLIAAILSVEACRELAAKAHGLGLEVLLEIHREEELAYLSPEVDMLGVNNRNLGTFHVDIANAAERMSAIQKHLETAKLCPLLVAESGIRTAADAHRLRQLGYRGFLIGETFMKTEQPGETLASFINAWKEIGQ